MKKILVLFLAFFCLPACEYDNYDSPDITFSGQLIYKEAPFLYDGNSSRNLFLFFQEGFGKIDWGTSMHTKADGSYTQLLAGGEYKLTLQNVKYPFEINEFPEMQAGYDSIYYNLQHNTTQNFHVTPYYEISDMEADIDGIDIAARFRIKKVSNTRIPAPAIVKVRIYLGINQHVNSQSPCVEEQEVYITDDEEINISISAVKYRSAYQDNFREHAFYRIALELENIPDYYLFSEIKEVTGIPEEFNDITTRYLKNYSQPFDVVSYFPDPRRGILADWLTSNPEIEYTMYDGWEDRLFMCAENWGGSTSLTGSVYQTFTLPAGRYVFIARRGFNWWDIENTGGTDRAYFAVARGKGIEWKSSAILSQVDCGDPGSRSSMAITLSLEQDMEISMGYVVNFPAGETNALSFISFTIYGI